MYALTPHNRITIIDTISDKYDDFFVRNYCLDCFIKTGLALPHECKNKSSSSGLPHESSCSECYQNERKKLINLESMDLKIINLDNIYEIMCPFDKTFNSNTSLIYGLVFPETEDDEKRDDEKRDDEKRDDEKRDDEKRAMIYFELGLAHKNTLIKCEKCGKSKPICSGCGYHAYNETVDEKLMLCNSFHTYSRKCWEYFYIEQPEDFKIRSKRNLCGCI
jgi:hypothetical protein